MLTMFVGPMFSGKTTRLLSAIERHQRRGDRILCFKPKIDGRYSDGEIVSHWGARCPAIPVSNADQINKIIETSEQVDAIAIDEIFMIDDGQRAVLNMLKKGVTVYVSSIETSANLNPFPVVASLLPWAGKIEKLTAVCAICKGDAQLTARRVQSIDEIAVGGEESYHPTCWSCHPLIEKLDAEKSGF